MSTTQEAVEAALTQAADYVATTQPLLDKQAAERDNYVAEVSRAVSKLVELRRVEPSKQNALRDKLAADPAACARFVVELAEKEAAAPSMGQPATVTPEASVPGHYKSNGRPLSASDRAVLYGDPAAEAAPMDTGHVN